MPLVRERVASQLGIPIDLKTDPMTAVARGAAIFAESRDWSEDRGQRKSTRASTTSSGAIELLVQYTARVSADRATVRLSAQLPGQGYRYRVLGPRGFDSGFAEFSGKAQLPLELHGLGNHEFTIEVVGPEGRAACPVQVVKINRTSASASAIPATQTVSVKIAKGPIADRRNVLVPLITKGTPLPAEGSQTFRLREGLSADAENRFDVELYNQADGVEDPQLNLPVGVFRFAGSDILEPGMRLPAGSPVIVNWSMDDNGLIRCAIDFPDIGVSFDQRNFYVAQEGHRNFDGEDGNQLVVAHLAAADQALAETNEALPTTNVSELAMLKRRLGRMHELQANSTDAEARRAATEEALHIQQELARLRNAPGNRKAVLMRDLIAFEEGVAEMIDDVDADLLTKLQMLGIVVWENIANEEWRNAREILDQMQGLFWRSLYQQPRFLIGMFEDLAPQRFAALDKDLHDRLVVSGQSAIVKENVDDLREVIRRILNNRMPIDVGSRKVAMLSGLVQ